VDFIIVNLNNDLVIAPELADCMAEVEKREEHQGMVLWSQGHIS
jgi:hypothetical protein